MIDLPRRLAGRVANSVNARIRHVRSSPLLSATAREARARESAGDYPAASNDTHLTEALAWLERAQDATPDGGFSRAYSLTWNAYFRAAGWQASYPETTGYIIPTLYSAARYLRRPDLASRATRAAKWEIDVQLPNGAVQGGVIGQRPTPAIFNTGQVMFGWLSAFEETGDPAFEAALRRAAEFLASVEVNGEWVRGNSDYARKDSTAYNARAVWALAEAGKALREPRYTDAAARILTATRRMQHANGWFPQCCLNDAQRPLLHTLAYTVRGMLEGGRVLEDAALFDSGVLAAKHLAERVEATGWMSGRFDSEWRGAADWSCLTGEAQMANNWMRLHEITGDVAWLSKVPAVMTYLKQRQNRVSADGGLRGGIAGSAPISGEYGSYEMLNWATKYFADALMRQVASTRTDQPSPVTRLA